MKVDVVVIVIVVALDHVRAPFSASMRPLFVDVDGRCAAEAEAAGRPGTDDRARFYGIARGSAMECSALLNVCRIQRGYIEEMIKAGKALLLRAVEMLTKVCR